MGKVRTTSLSGKTGELFDVLIMMYDGTVPVLQNLSSATWRGQNAGVSGKASFYSSET